MDMKRVLALILTLTLSVGFMLSCSKDKKENPKTAKDLTTTDVLTSAGKLLKAGNETEVEFTVNFKPVFSEEGITKEEFEAQNGMYFESKPDGTYSVVFKIKMEMDMSKNNFKMDFILKDTSLTDIIYKDGKIYVNAKSVFSFMIESLKSVFGEDGSIYSQFLKWPYENEYISLDQVNESMIPQIGNGEPNGENDNQIFVPFTELGSIISAIQNAIPTDQLLHLARKIEEAGTKANALTADSQKIEIKLDKTNAGTFITDISKILKTDLAAFVDGTIAALRKSDQLPDDIKQKLIAFNKDEFQKMLDEQLSDEQIQADSEDIEKVIGDGHFNVSFGTADNAFSVKLDVQSYMPDASDYTMMNVIVEAKSKQKAIGDITVPEKLLTEKEINDLLALFGGTGGSGDDFGDYDMPDDFSGSGDAVA